jgi:serine/threonine protein phosphatase PrpC
MINKKVLTALIISFFGLWTSLPFSLQAKNDPNTGARAKDNFNTGAYEYEFGFATNHGARDYMEDEYDIKVSPDLRSSKLLLGSHSRIDSYVAVFDGHGGKKVSELLNKYFYRYIDNALQKLSSPSISSIGESVSASFVHFNNALERYGKEQDALGKGFLAVGSTAVCALTFGEYIVIANVGDSRAVSGKGYALTLDHKPLSEINRPGVKVYGKRLGGVLAISRAFGDFALKKDGLIALPAIRIVKVADLQGSNNQYPLIILASDGIWDFLSNKEAADIASKSIEINSLSLNLVAEKIILAAIAKEPKIQKDKNHELAKLSLNNFVDQIAKLDEETVKRYLKDYGYDSHDNQTVVIQQFKKSLRMAPGVMIPEL